MRTLLKLFLPLALLLAAVAPAAAADESPAPEGVPYSVSTYSGTLPIATPEDAHAAVLAAGGPFDEFTYNDGALIGATKYYDVKGESGSAATWIVVYTYGWNDCESGCINGHSFVYQVDPLTGAATFDSHQGDVLPADAPAALIELTGRSGGVVPEPEWRTLTGKPTACPEGITEPNAPISSDTALPCLLPDGSLFPMVMEDGYGDGVGEGNDWVAMYNAWMEEFGATLEPCAEGVDVTDPTIAPCVAPDGSIVGALPLFAMDMDKSGDREGGWTTALPTIILAALLAWIGAATLVGWSKRRAA